jgi:hypothetical protein
MNNLSYQGFTLIRNGLKEWMKKNKLPGYDFNVYIFLLMNCDFRTGVWTGTASDIAIGIGDLNLKKRVKTSLVRLRSNSFIVYPAGNGRRAGYDVTINKYEPMVGSLSGTRSSTSFKGGSDAVEYHPRPVPGPAEGPVQGPVPGSAESQFYNRFAPQPTDYTSHTPTERCNTQNEKRKNVYKEQMHSSAASRDTPSLLALLYEIVGTTQLATSLADRKKYVACVKKLETTHLDQTENVLRFAKDSVNWSYKIRNAETPLPYIIKCSGLIAAEMDASMIDSPTISSGGVSAEEYQRLQKKFFAQAITENEYASLSQEQRDTLPFPPRAGVEGCDNCGGSGYYAVPNGKIGETAKCNCQLTGRSEPRV